MPITLIITVYKDYEALERVLDSVCKQSMIPKQIILAHDAIDRTIHQTISQFSSLLNITHIDQEDTGFNKNRIKLSTFADLNLENGFKRTIDYYLLNKISN